MQLITVSQKEFEDLMKLTPEVQKLKNKINEMAIKIKSKDLQLKNLQQAHKNELQKCINVSHLTDVSIS